MRPPSAARSTLRRKVAFGAAFCAAVLLLVWNLLGPYKGYDADSVTLTIPKGATPGEVAEGLHGAGVVRSAPVLRAMVRLRGVASSLQAGEYEFEGPMTPYAVLEKIRKGAVLLHRLTIPEGLTRWEVIDRITALELATPEDLDQAFHDTEAIRDLDGQARDLEGYLYPDTYQFARGSSARELLDSMVKRFKEAFGEPLRERARGIGMSVRDVVTLASLIEKETSIPDERPRISAVFHNRLRLGMALQCDPTVIFALASAGKYNGVLTRDDLAFASPYNTYLNPGLPPGPIASPGLAALEAAVNPAPVDDLYFVADGSGGHTFSTSLEDHLRAVAKYRHRKSGV